MKAMTMFNIKEAFTEAALEAGHGRHVAKLADTEARRAVIALREIAKQTAEDRKAAAEAEYAAAREAAKWLSEDGQRAISDAMKAWGDIRKMAALARVQWRAGGEWRESIRAMLAARARAAVIDAMPLSPGDAAQSGIVYGIIASHVSRSARGEKNAPLMADSVTPDDVWQYAAELAIRAGDSVNGMPTYGGMIRHHKSAAAMFRRDAFARRAGYITLSIDDSDSADYLDALSARGYVHTKPEAEAPLDIDALASEWSGRVSGANIHAHRAALADMRADIAEAEANAAAANKARAARWCDAAITDSAPDDAATMGNAVVLSLVHGMTFDGIRDTYAATDATYERYAAAAASRRALAAPTVTDSDIWRAERDVAHVCYGAGVECHMCTVSRWIAYDAAERRRIDAAKNRRLDDVRRRYTDSGKAPEAYVPAPLASAAYVTPVTDRDRVHTLALRKLARVRAVAVIDAAAERAAAVIAEAGKDKPALKLAKRRAKRITTSAAATAEAIRRDTMAAIV